MITDFRVSVKTRPSSFCGLACCGNKFGRVYKSRDAHIRKVNRMVKMRRYAKHVENQRIRRDILSQLHEELEDVWEFNQELAADDADYWYDEMLEWDDPFMEWYDI